MEIFVDSANIEEIKRLHDLGIIDGVTTNPTHIANEGKKFKDVVQEICSFVKGDVSAEVVATDYKDMIREAHIVADWAKNIVVKIPLTKDGIKAVSTLSGEGIKTNVTLCFSANQALLAAKAGAYIISPFAGRLDDIGHHGSELVSEIKQVYDNYGYKTKVLYASVRHPLHMKEAALMRADIATAPAKVIEQMFAHPLTDAGLKRFLDDWAKLGQKIE